MTRDDRSDLLYWQEKAKCTGLEGEHVFEDLSLDLGVIDESGIPKARWVCIVVQNTT